MNKCLNMYIFIYINFLSFNRNNNSTILNASYNIDTKKYILASFQIINNHLANKI